MTSHFRLGTRGSALALAQARQVAKNLMDRWPESVVEMVVIKTAGDQQAPLPGAGGQEGLFTREIQKALLDGRIDAAVHSLKDLPTDPTPGLALGAVLRREDPRDGFITRTGLPLKALPLQARVATGSFRRQAQLLAKWPFLKVEPIRGNVDSRIRALLEGRADALVLAVAGLKRLGRADEMTGVLSLEEMLPAPGQGCVALEVRDTDSSARALLKPLSHGPSELASRVERQFLQALGGGCRKPLGALARPTETGWRMDVGVFSPDGQKSLRAFREGHQNQVESWVAELAEEVTAQGARELLFIRPGF